MEEINLKELFDYFKERILIISIIILAVLILGSVYSTFFKTPLYNSTSTIILVGDDGTSGGEYTQNDINLNKSLVSTYSEIIRSRKVLEKVIDNLSLDYSYGELKSNVTVSTTANTEIINITVSDADNYQAQDITYEIVKVFGKEIKDIYKLQNVQVVDEASLAGSPYNINIMKDTIIYFLVGIVLGLGTVFVIYYFDTSIKSADDIENKLGIPVLGIVPKVTSKRKK